MTRLAMVLVNVALAVAFVCTQEARAGCLSAVVVDGVVLIGHGAYDSKLPRAAGQIPAVAPACNDSGPPVPDGRTEVVRFAGIPADIAVRSVDGGDVYIAPGSLTALATHPLHQSAPRLSRRRCGRTSTLDGVAGRADFDALELIAGGRSHFYRVDAGTTLVNRPAYQPIRPGQRLAITATRCGSRLIADRIAFTGPTIVPERYVERRSSAAGTGLPWVIVLPIAAIGLALVAWLLERVTRPKGSR